MGFAGAQDHGVRVGGARRSDDELVLGHVCLGPRLALLRCLREVASGVVCRAGRWWQLQGTMPLLTVTLVVPSLGVVATCVAGRILIVGMHRIHGFP